MFSGIIHEQKEVSGQVKTDGILDKLMHFLVHNGFQFTVAVMCLVHATLLMIMLADGIMPLAQYNILSVVVYVFCFLLCGFGHIMPAYVSIILEVTAYTIVSTYFIGLRCGTYCFLFSIVPIIIYFGSYLFKGAARWSIVLMLLLNFTVFVILYVIFIDKPPIYELTSSARLVLVIFSSFVMVFSTVFYNAIYIYSSEVEVNSLEKSNRQLSADAQEDELTKLLNRRGFLPLIEQLMRDGRDSRFCVAFCDIDNFKRINDSYGHDAGDEVLRHITKQIMREMHNCDICRWGGEEIVILMKDCDLAAAREKLENLRQNLESNPTIFYNKRIPATITIGLEEYKEGLAVPEDIIKVADRRMYNGKQSGKNIIISDDASSERSGI